MLFFSSGASIITFLFVWACLVLTVIFIHKEKHVNLKLVASELTVEVVPISRLFRDQSNHRGVQHGMVRYYGADYGAM